MNPRYFYGKPTDLGNVAALKQTTFRALCEEVIMKAVLLPLTREALHALPEKEQNERKKVAYLTACTFKSNPSPRTKGNAGPCNLICLDIDRAEDARRLLESHWPTMLKGFHYLVHHTARSTPTKPRLRIIVEADSLPPELYPQAVDCIAQRVGVNVTRESLVIVQPMYLPTTFQHETLTKIIQETAFEGGAPFTTADLHPKGEIPPPHEVPEEAPPPAGTEPVSDLLHFREPMEGVTIDDVQGALDCLDADCTMIQWIEMGAAIKHQFGDAGFALWNGWSLKGKKYTTEEDTRYRWNSLRGQTKDRIPVTIRSLFRLARSRGWVNDRLAKEAFQACLEWLRDSGRTTEELLDHGAEKIARVTPLLGETQKATLIQSLKDRLKTRGMTTSIPAIRRDVGKLEDEAERKTMGAPPWAAGLVFVTCGGFFYRQNVDRRFTPDVINLMYTAPSLGDKVPPTTAVYLVKQAQIPQVENLRYDPARGEEKIFSDGGVPYVNIYRPTYAKKDVKRMEEAGKIVEEHVANSILDPAHRTHWLDYLCYLVQHPGKKIRHAMMLQGTKGSGKSWFAEVMQVVLGFSNTSILMPSGIMDNQYNDWAVGRQLIVMNEVRIVGHNRYEVMDKLKPCITDDVISLNVKFENHRSVPNITNYILFTNYPDAIAIQDDERRYFVLQSPLQQVSQVLALGEGYFDRIYKQITDNPGGLRAYFEHRTISKSFNPNGRAPVTPYMTDLAHAAASPLMAAVMNVLGDESHPLVRKDLVSIGELRRVIDASEQCGKYTDQALSAVLRELGWTRGVRCRINGERHQLWTRNLTGDAQMIAQERAEIL